jgi:CheY-like chemotaxis protein
MNLIGNACKFTENGHVYISVKSLSVNESLATIQFTIKDTGIGISKEKHESVFDEFSQVESLNYSGNGSGLGLPIVKKLLAKSDSDITLESDLGKGATFKFTLTFETLKEAFNKPTPIKIDSNILVGKKILIVEDNRINQIVTQKILEKKDIICSIAEQGDEAIAKIKANHYDLVLMDINMPIKNGIEASKEIRKFNKTIPIIALTAVEIEEMRNNIYMSGMNDIVVKPYDISKFIDVIIKNISSNMNVNI